MVASEMPPSTPVQQLTPCEMMQAEIAKYGDWDHNIMQAIGQAENRACNPLKHNLSASETHRRADGSVICVGSYGVMQVGCLHYGAGDNVDDMGTNIKIAHRLWQNRQQWGNGYEAWTMFSNGTYRGFLK